MKFSDRVDQNHFWSKETQITANFDLILKNANKANFEHLNLFRRNFFPSGILWYFEVWFLAFISDWQVYKMAGSKLLEAFLRGIW